MTVMPAVTALAALAALAFSPGIFPDLGHSSLYFACARVGQKLVADTRPDRKPESAQGAIAHFVLANHAWTLRRHPAPARDAIRQLLIWALAAVRCRSCRR
jgi:hypothetical protein